MFLDSQITISCEKVAMFEEKKSGLWSKKTLISPWNGQESLPILRFAMNSSQNRNNLEQEDLKFLGFLFGKRYKSVTFWTDKPGWKIVLTMTKDFPAFLTRNSLYFEDSPLICWEVSLFSSSLLSEPTHRHSKLRQTLLNHFLNGRNIASWQFSDAGRIVGFLRPQMIFLHITYWEKSVNCLDIVSYFGKMVEV